MQSFQLDASALMMSAFGGLVVFLISELRRPGKQAMSQQQQFVLAALAAGGAYLVRQYEGRGNQQESFAVALAAMDSKNEERFRTVFGDVHDIKLTQGRILEMLGERSSPPRARRK